MGTICIDENSELSDFAKRLLTSPDAGITRDEIGRVCSHCKARPLYNWDTSIKHDDNCVVTRIRALFNPTEGINP